MATHQVGDVWVDGNTVYRAIQSNNTNAFSFGFEINPHPRSSMPNITTRVVQLKAGWVGQVVVNNKIVWESKPKVQHSKVNGAPSGETLASRAAKRRIDRKLAELLG